MSSKQAEYLEDLSRDIILFNKENETQFRARQEGNKVVIERWETICDTTKWFMCTEFITPEQGYYWFMGNGHCHLTFNPPFDRHADI